MVISALRLLIVVEADSFTSESNLGISRFAVGRFRIFSKSREEIFVICEHSYE